MAAYVISQYEVIDPGLISVYLSLAQDAIAKYGGRYLVRGGRIQVLEGESTPSATVIVEFPSMEQALGWYESREYAEARAVRQRALRRTLILVEGVADH